MPRTWLAAGALFACLLPVAACGSTQEPADSADSTPESSSTVGGATPAAPPVSPSPPTPSESPVPATGRKLVLNITNHDGYQATLKVTIAPHVIYEAGVTPPGMEERCAAYIPGDSVERALVGITTELIPRTVKGFTWPEASQQTVSVEADDMSLCDGNQESVARYVHSDPKGPITTQGLFETEITPNSPDGFGDSGPWKSISVTVDNVGCDVVSKDPAFEPASTLYDKDCAYTVEAE
ncbi:hypothetical protein [Streptomyces sp. NPDC088730]|uniref:hypothetical protein n=1 Tax=Streptomyces sp. NPDC088730 TaxID=3365877 RepID=UPI0037F4FD2D